MSRPFLYAILLSAFVFSCGQPEAATGDTTATTVDTIPSIPIQDRLAKYTSVRLTADLDHLDDNQRMIVAKLIIAAQSMDFIFWEEAYGPDWQVFRRSLPDADTRRFVNYNYGPWDRLAGNEPFVEGVGPKPLGANFYPTDMSKEEFEVADLPDKKSLYTLLRRDSVTGELITVPYSQAFKLQQEIAATQLLECVALTKNKAFAKYLKLRAAALYNDDYQPSDLAWMDMRDNDIDVVIGPIETYEDQLFGYKAAHEAYVLIKDQAWSKRLERYAKFLPELQRGLPVPEEYKAENPGSNAQLNAYDVVFYAGDCNAGSKTIAINLPNDEEVQLQKGARRLQLKNAMRAKFDKILMPIAGELITAEQRDKVTFDAFFSNTMFHEVAHGLGIKNTLDGSGTVRESLLEHASAIEEGKADILGLYMIEQLHKKGEIKGSLEEYYVTFMASIFRSVRFGASSAHGKANMIRFNYFQEKGAFERLADGTYRVDIDNLKAAAKDLTATILTLQGDGNYQGAADLITQKAVIGPALQADLDRLSEKGIPVDVIFQQGLSELGLNR